MVSVPILPMEWEEYLNTPNESLLAEINFRRGQVMGLTLKVEQLEKQIAESEEKFKLALDFQRERDAQIVEAMPVTVDQEYTEDISFNGDTRIIETYRTYMFERHPAEVIRKGQDPAW